MHEARMFQADIMRRVSASELASLEAATDPYSRYLAVFNNLDRPPVRSDDPHVVLLFQSLEVLRACCRRTRCGDAGMVTTRRASPSPMTIVQYCLGVAAFRLNKAAAAAASP